MYLYANMSVCIYPCMYVGPYIHIITYMHACVHIHIGIHVGICVYDGRCMQIYVHTYTQMPCTSVCVHAYVAKQIV